MDELFRDFATFHPVVHWSPRVDISEDDKSITIKADLPGMNPEDIHLTVKDHHMTLTGEKTHDTKKKGENRHMNECFYGSFSRTFRLSDRIELKKIKAQLKNGVLEITLPKQPEAKPKRIPVQMN
jgi:HSP20 family protein